MTSIIIDKSPLIITLSGFGPSISPRFAPIVALLKRRCPSAILRGIRTIIIDPIDARASWPRPHVSKEVCKVLPASANLYASSAIIFVCRSRRVIAALPHVLPNFVFSAVATSVLIMKLLKSFALGATARCGFAKHKRIGGCDRGAAAVALTKPLSSPVLVSLRGIYSDKATETLTSNIFEGGHGDLRERLLCQVAVER